MSDAKIALVTGANKGIGVATVRQLAQLGYTVLLGARDATRGEQAAADLRGAGLNVRFLALDVTNDASIAAAVKQVETEFGRLDVLVNNAALGTFGEPPSIESLQQWRAMFDANVIGLVAVTQAFLPLVKKSAAGRIVNVSSNLASLTWASTKGSPTAQFSPTTTAYSATKAAVNMFTVHLATELSGTPIKVNAAHPGWVKTDMGGYDAPLELDEGAKTSVWLATLPADGPTGGYFHQGQTLPW